MASNPPSSKPTSAKDTQSKPQSQTSQRTTYISSNGPPLTTPPITARVSRSASNIYNFLGLYFVSLFSLDPYTAAQTSQFNTRGPGRGTSAGTSNNNTSAGPRWGFGRIPGTGTGTGNTRGGGGGGSGGGAGRRLGTVDDVRGPECGSCG